MHIEILTKQNVGELEFNKKSQALWIIYTIGQ